MRHLITAELLLYAEGELEDRGLCRHVVDCVDCKAQLVDLQETYVLAASAIREQLQASAPEPEQLARLRTRMAAETQRLSIHLSTEELLLTIESAMSVDREAHLAACASCQHRVADLNVQLAAIEYELRRKAAFELPVARRAAALAALRIRIEEVVTARRSASVPVWARMPHMAMPSVPAVAGYGAALAAACLFVWAGWNAIPVAPDISAPVITAQSTDLVPAVTVPFSEPAQIIQATAEAAETRPDRFDWNPAQVQRSAAIQAPVLIAIAAPDLGSTTTPREVVAVDLPSIAELPEPPADSRTLLAGVEVAPQAQPVVPTPLPERPELVAEGSLMLAKTGLWKADLQAGGSDRAIRFLGSVASEGDRIKAETALLAAADGRPVEFAISVRSSRVGNPVAQLPAGAARQPTLGGPVRTALLQYYEDAARRSFKAPDQSLLEGELDRYVSTVLRHEAELLAHVHALDSLLSRSSFDQARGQDSFRRVIEYHLNGIARHEDGVYEQLSEALPRRYWAYRSERRDQGEFESLGSSSSQLLRDALALDQALTSLFFGSNGALDIRESNLSTADLLSQVRKHTRQLRAAIR